MAVLSYFCAFAHCFCDCKLFTTLDVIARVMMALDVLSEVVLWVIMTLDVIAKVLIALDVLSEVISCV